MHVQLEDMSYTQYRREIGVCDEDGRQHKELRVLTQSTPVFMKIYIRPSSSQAKRVSL